MNLKIFVIARVLSLASIIGDSELTPTELGPRTFLSERPLSASGRCMRSVAPGMAASNPHFGPCQM